MHLTPRRGTDLAIQEDPALAEALNAKSLIEAAGRGKTELVKALCSNGAPVNPKSVSKDVQCKLSPSRAGFFLSKNRVTKFGPCGLGSGRE